MIMKNDTWIKNLKKITVKIKNNESFDAIFDEETNTIYEYDEFLKFLTEKVKDYEAELNSLKKRNKKLEKAVNNVDILIKDAEIEVKKKICQELSNKASLTKGEPYSYELNKAIDLMISSLKAKGLWED